MTHMTYTTYIDARQALLDYARGLPRLACAGCCGVCARCAGRRRFSCASTGRERAPGPNPRPPDLNWAGLNSRIVARHRSLTVGNLFKGNGGADVDSRYSAYLRKITFSLLQ